MKQLNMLGVRRQFFRGGVRRLRSLRPGDELMVDSALLGSSDMCHLQSPEFGFYPGTELYITMNMLS